jgi:hypothetical protein
MDDADVLISVTLKRWEWDDIVLSLTRYVEILQGSYDAAFGSDVEWAEELGHMTDRLREAVDDKQPKVSP